MCKRLVYSISFIVLLSVGSSVQALTEITTANGNGADTYLSNDDQSGDYGPDSMHGGGDAFSVRTCAGIRQKIGYVRFDISNVTGDLTGATLSVYLTTSKRSRTWGIYGLVDETLDNWDETTISYNNAPGILPASLGYYAIDENKLQRLGDFDVVQGDTGTYTTSDINDLNLDSFIGSDTNKLLTFILIYETDSTDTNPDWWMSAKEGDPDQAPKLTFPNALIPPATYPNPENGEMVYDTTVLLQWQVGSYAAQHDIYLSDNFGDVDRATSSSPMGPDNVYKARQDANSYTVTDLIPGTTYYWRIDEVNNLHPDRLWRGEIWSFNVQSLTAYDPIPPDDFMYVAPKMTLRWTAGSGAGTGHRVYLGDDFDDVSNAPVDSDALPYRAFLTPSADPNWNPSRAGVTLGFNKTYYWRVDEVDGANRYKGDVWSFTTVYAPPTTEPNLVGWWKFDGDASDSSDYRCDGTVYGNPEPNYVEGVFDSAIYLLGTTGDAPNQYIDLPIGSVISTLTNSTFAVWVNRIATVGQQWHRIFDFGTDTTNYMALLPFRSSSPPTNFEITSDEVLERVSWGTYDNEGTVIPTDEWHHFAMTFNADTNTLTLYVDGVVPDDGGELTDITLTPSDLGFTINNWVGRAQGWTGTTYPALFRGYVDDLRIYDRALSQAEIQDILTPPRAWMPSPANGATNVQFNPTLRWTPGRYADKHNVYFGTDFNDVSNADTSTAEIYKSSQSENVYEPGILGFTTTYYWRIDEVNEPNIWKGPIWSFTTADYIAVDDFEDYNDYPPNRVFDTWKDYATNNSGATVGYLGFPYAEIEIVHEGDQSMPLFYDHDGTVNEGTPYQQTGTDYYSQTDRTWDTPQDWTEHGIAALTLWFQGYRESVGGISYNAGTGTYTMTGSGTDIWDVNNPRETGFHDEFHFAYKQLYGEGEIIAKVESVQNTHASAKAGVMIRETLDKDSRHVMCVVTPGDGVKFEYRYEKGGASTSVSDANVSAPHWVRLTRSGNTFTAYHSEDGKTWLDVGSADESWIDIAMSATTNIGLALTSHDPDLTCTAGFSNVSTTGTVTPDGPFTQSQDIGIFRNDAEGLYVILEDDDGNSHIVEHPEPNATQIYPWREWLIDLIEFRNAGVNLEAIKMMSIGVGDPEATSPSGKGTIYIDDIRLYRPRCVLSERTTDFAKLDYAPAGDPAGDCVIDYQEIEIMVRDWLFGTLPSTAEEIWLEAESADTMSPPMQVWSDMADASSGQYIAVVPGNSSGENPPTQGVATYVFTVNGGTYKILGRVIAPSDTEDSFWFRIEGATTQTTNHPSGWIWWDVSEADGSIWHWDEVNSDNDNDQTVQFTMAPGTYTLEVAYREDGALLDHLLITDNLNLNQADLPPWSTDVNINDRIDFEDFAIVAEHWLEEQLWPQL